MSPPRNAHLYYRDKDRRTRDRAFTSGRIDAFSMYKQIGYAHFVLMTAWLLDHHRGGFRLTYDYTRGWQSMTHMLVARRASIEKARALEQAYTESLHKWLNLLVT